MNVEPSVLEAMQSPVLGHLDPDFHDLMSETIEMLRVVYGTSEGAVLPLQATGMSGMEMGLVNLLEPGDVVVVANAGFFGGRIAQVAARCGAEVIEVKGAWGESVPNQLLLDALDRHSPVRLLAVVHAETSTGVEHPLAELSAQLGQSDTLLFVDCVTSLGAVPVRIDDWGIDFAYSCTQKSLGGPPGMSPVAFSQRALERVQSRARPVPFSFDVGLLLDYWVKRPATYHHTAPILHVYALHEALRLVLEEGLPERWGRHARVGRDFQAAVRSRGLELLATPDRRLPNLTAIRVPEDVDGRLVQRRMLSEHSIEIGGGLGPDAPEMWRVGLMGQNARPEAAERVLSGLASVLGAGADGR
jgi:alanine-glyoxylate transaminase/serine-glyoxylate transaminase/serine-pyruvate transaminase